MTEWVLFGTGTPGAPNETDGPIAVSTGFQINDGGTYWCTGVEFYASATPPTGVSVALWSRSTDETPSGLGTLLASKAAPGAITGGTRNRINFDTAVQVTAALFSAGLYATMRTANNYVATGAFFASAGQTSGPITAYQNGGGVGANGRFKVTPTPTSAADSYPNTQFGGGGYWVSPVITDVDPGGVTPDPISVAGAITVGEPVVSGAATVVTPVSVVGGIVIGEPTVRATMTHPVTERPSGFEPLVGMFRDALRNGSIRIKPTACPKCGTPLESARGCLHCSFDGSTY
ncbi:MAG: hypothetical protein V4515_14400 [Chloroflexota bacterium]